ncbi:zinc-binding alcohol dehydrogenase family protein [Rhodococcus sp. NPDC059968]|uniref:quinone oxidoreductase family protein n=1 Tax=Rhodococcus sp. NPDC059968 TaxID=3347017 RepID=UPI0036734428
MLGVTYNEHGGLERLALRRIADPEPADDEVVVRVSYVGLNAVDLLALRGLPRVRNPLPMVPGGDVAGVVERAGRIAEQAGWRPGDRVVVYPTHPREGINGESALGGLSELMRCHMSQLVSVPAAVALRDAAALPTAYGAAAHMLFDVGECKQGETVLVLGAAGGVGTAVVQLAQAHGMTAIAAVGSASKARYVSMLGAKHVIDTSEQDVMSACHELYGRPSAIDRETHLPGHTAVNSPGVDVVVNFVGGNTWHPALRCVRAGGRILTCGALAGHMVDLDLRYVWSLQLQIRGATGWTPEVQRDLVELVRTERLRPVVDGVFPMEDFLSAYEKLESRSAMGKILIQVDPESD